MMRIQTLFFNFVFDTADSPGESVSDPQVFNHLRTSMIGLARSMAMVLSKNVDGFLHSLPTYLMC